MAFLTLCATNAFYCYAIHFIILKIIMEFLVDAVEFVTLTRFFVIKINFRFSVTVDTPAHA